MRVLEILFPKWHSPLPLFKNLYLWPKVLLPLLDYSALDSSLKFYWLFIHITIDVLSNHSKPCCYWNKKKNWVSLSVPVHFIHFVLLSSSHTTPPSLSIFQLSEITFTSFKFFKCIFCSAWIDLHSFLIVFHTKIYFA